MYHYIIKHDAGKEKTLTTDEKKELWLTLGATFLPWIYVKISSDLLHTILESNATAMEAWNRLMTYFKKTSIHLLSLLN